MKLSAYKIIRYTDYACKVGVTQVGDWEMQLNYLSWSIPCFRLHN